MSDGVTERDRVLAGEKWEFDAEVARVFDDMLARSIPQYQTMRYLTAQLVLRHLKENGARAPKLLDLGCSRGGAIADMIAYLPEDARFLGLEVSEPMVRAARSRFAKNPNVRVRQWDLRHGLPDEANGADVALCVLTLQFVPIEYRAKILRTVRAGMRPGGLFVLVEKVLGQSAETNAQLVETYHATKRLAGYTDEQIERKRLSLEGVLVPITATWNEELMASAGFPQPECFWRFLNFAGWIVRL